MARPGLIPQLTVGVLAVAVTGLIAVQILNLGPLLPQLALVGGLGAIVAVLLAVGLRRPRLVTAAGAGLLMAYALTLVDRSDSSVAATSAPVIAGGIVLSIQLAWWATELRTTARESALDLARRGAQLGASAVVAGLIAEVIWQASRIHLGQGLSFLVFGLLAAIGLAALFLAVSSLRRTPRREPLIARSTMQPRAIYLPSHSLSPHKGLSTLIVPADAPTSRRRRNGVGLRSMIAGVLLLADAAVIAIALYFSGISKGPNAAPAITLGLTVAGAIVMGWLGLSVEALVRPVTTFEELSPANTPPPPTGLGSLGVIRSMTRRAWKTGRCDAEFGTYLASLDSRLAEARSPDKAPKSLAEVGALLADLERGTDA